MSGDGGFPMADAASRTGDWHLAMVDRAWFRPLPDELLERALASAIGRRQLWRQLLRSDRLVELRRPRRRDAPLPATVTLPAATLDALALDLGAMAFAGAIRILVDRSAVLALRAALGDARYAAALGQRNRDDRHDAEAAGALKAALGDERRLRRIVRERGAHELAAWLRAEDPRAAELLALRFPPGVAPNDAAAWLDAGIVAQHVALDREGAPRPS